MWKVRSLCLLRRVSHIPTKRFCGGSENNFKEISQSWQTTTLGCSHYRKLITTCGCWSHIDTKVYQWLAPLEIGVLHVLFQDYLEAIIETQFELETTPLPPLIFSYQNMNLKLKMSVQILSVIARPNTESLK